ncbi:hypothetical protein Tco_1265063 [Tanacetum coccineum]
MTIPTVVNAPSRGCEKDQSEDFSYSNVESTSTDEESFSSTNSSMMRHHLPNSEPVSSEGDVILIFPNLVVASTTHSELSLPDYKAFYIDNDHFKEKSSGSTTTHVDFSQYDSFIFDLSINSYHPSNRSDFHEEFADELAQIISPPEYDRFCFKIEPELGNLTMDVDCPDCEDSQFCHSSRD